MIGAAALGIAVLGTAHGTVERGGRNGARCAKTRRRVGGTIIKTNLWLIAGGVLSAVAAGLHLAIIAGGPAWYRFFGAGEKMVRLAEAGAPRAWLTTLGIAAVLAMWAGYAFAGAGLLPRPPLLRTGLAMIAVIYLLRGLIVVPMLIARPGVVTPFWVWSSLIVLGYGVAYAAGTWQAWELL